MKHDEPHDRDPDLGPNLERALDADVLPPVRAEFREQLRRRFVEGVDSRLRVATAGTERPRARHWFLWAAGAIAAGSLLVWWAQPPEAPHGARLELLADTPTGLRVDEAPFGPGTALTSGSRLATDAEGARLRVAGVYVMELGPHTSVTLARGFGDDGQTIELALAVGSLRFVACPNFAPRRMTVQSPDAEVLVTGTEFGIDVDPGSGTCVCCNEGSIEVRPRASATVERLIAGRMIYCFASDMPPMLGEAKGPHLAPITELRRFR